MSELYINEKSLEGQFQSLEEFLDNSLNFVRCLEWFRKSGTSWRIFKKSSLYTSKITKEQHFYDLRSYRVSSEKNTNDILRKLKSSLLLLQNDPPFWDVENIVQKGEYYLDGINITGSSIAEAIAKDGAVLSFNHRLYHDIDLKVTNGEISHSIFSIATIQGMSKNLFENYKLEINDFLKLYFKGTRLNFTYLDDEYGLQDFEKSEVQDCIKNFIRFTNHASWNEIYQDGALVYKSYNPSDKNDWFRESKFRDKKIDKFRCINPKRCFGFKEQDIFYVLRIERNHKISDNG